MSSPLRGHTETFPPTGSAVLPSDVIGRLRRPLGLHVSATATHPRQRLVGYGSVQ